MSDANIKITEKQLQLVEKFGLIIQQGGIQPAASRIFALLMVSDVVELTFEQLYQTLHLSKSATSNALSMLQQIQRVEFITKPGDRKRYFKLKSSNWRQDACREIESLTKMRPTMQEILDQRTKKTPEFNEKIAEMIDMFEFLNQRIPPLIEEWEKQYQKKKK